MTGGPPPSKSAVTKAGDVLRDTSRWGTLQDEFQPFHDAVEVVDSWRSTYGAALNAATMNLRSALHTLGIPDAVFDVKGRHKKLASITSKLQKRPTMRLAQMEDIAGCRAVVPSVQIAYRLAEQLSKRSVRSQILRTDDYMADPRPGGYRALHLHTSREVRSSKINGVWPVEVQIRTEAQHRWAQSVEAWDQAYDTDVKHEVDDGLGYAAFAAASEWIRASEQGLSKGHLERQLRTLLDRIRQVQDEDRADGF